MILNSYGSSRSPCKTMILSSVFSPYCTAALQLQQQTKFVKEKLKCVEKFNFDIQFHDLGPKSQR